MPTKCKYCKKYCNGSEWMSECDNNVSKNYGKGCPKYDYDDPCECFTADEED